MHREHSDHELKLTFDPTEPGAVQKLIKELIALANSGGGTVVIGTDEIYSPGVDESLVQKLDSARLMDQANRYIAPARISVGHDLVKLENGNCVVRLRVEDSGRYPVVFAKDGQYTKGGKTRNAFREGDIYIRRGSQSVRATYTDIVRIVDAAEERGRRSFIEHLHEVTEKMVRLPEGSTPIVLAATPTGEMAGVPEAMLHVVLYRRRIGDTSAILSGQELLRVFLARDQFELTPERRGILIRSGLRRNTTLYFWLIGVRDPEYVEKILLDTLDDKDRDKSDASHTILELASLYASDEPLRQILTKMSSSNYAHFRRAASEWRGRAEERVRFASLADSMRIDGVAAEEISTDDLLRIASDAAHHVLNENRPRVYSDLLRNIGRLLLLRDLQSRWGFRSHGVVS